MQKVVSFTGDLKDFPEHTVASYVWTVDGLPAGTGEIITVDLGVGDHVVTVQLQDGNATDLAPLVTGNYTVATPVTVQISVPNGIVFTDVVLA